MSIRTILKSYFETGKKPTQAQFSDLIDSVFNLDEDDVADLGAEALANKKTTLADNSDTYYPTQKAVKTAVDAKQDTLVSATNIKTINGESILGSGDLEIASGGSSFWTPKTATKVSGTSITIPTDLTAIFVRGLIVKWTESGVVRNGYVVSSTYASGTGLTTVNFIGDTMASIDTDSFKYALVGAVEEKFIYAGYLGAVATDIANSIWGNQTMRVLGCDLWVDVAGTTNSTTIDINIDGTSAFTTKPTLGSGVQYSATPFSATTEKTLSLNGRLSLDLDAYQTTNAKNLYVKLLLWPTRYNNLA